MIVRRRWFSICSLFALAGVFSCDGQSDSAGAEDPENSSAGADAGTGKQDQGTGGTSTQQGGADAGGDAIEGNGGASDGGAAGGGAASRADAGAVGDAATGGNAARACVQELVVGSGNTGVVLTDDVAWCWGSNLAGQLGDGSSPHPLPFASTDLGERRHQLGFGSLHGCALADGSAECWGDNRYGQLGDGGMSARLDPGAVDVLGADVTSLSVGPTHNCAILQNQSLWCWGRSNSGQLGDGTRPTSNTQPVQVKDLTDVTAVAIGGAHTCAIVADGGLWCWGNNNQGQLGFTSAETSVPDPTRVTALEAVVEVALGSSHSCARLSDNTVWCWGSFYGQDGPGMEGASKPVPTQVTELGDSARALALGASHACALLDDGSVWCWGANTGGQLGSGGTDNLESATPVAGLGTEVAALGVGELHTCVVKTDESVWCWGDNSQYQVGTPTGTACFADSCIPTPTLVELPCP